MSLIVDNIILLFKSQDHLIEVRYYLQKCHPSMKFSFEKERNCFFLDVEVSGEGKKVVTTVNRKPTFSGALKHYEIF